MKPWERIRDFARQHGADVVPHDTEQMVIRGGVRYAPASPSDEYLALWWRPGIVYVADTRLEHPRTIGGIIHELGHALATRQKPDYSEEFDFFGWEWLVAHQLKCLDEWEESNQQYTFEDGNYWKVMTLFERETVLTLARREGTQKGNIVDGKPVVVRKPVPRKPSRIARPDPGVLATVAP